MLSYTTGMAQRKTLNERQVAALRWVRDGCLEGVMADVISARISAAALRNRGLVRTSGRGRTWAARITSAGEEYLQHVDGPCPPVPRQPNVSVTQQLVDDVVAAGGSLRVARKRWGATGGVDFERRARLAVSHGKVPRGSRLVVKSVSPEELVIELVGAGTVTTDDDAASRQRVSISERLRRPHRFVAATKDAAVGVKADEDGRLRIGGTPGVVYLRVSREQLRRALLILDGLFKELERRGHTVVEESHSSYDHHAGVAISIREHRYPVELLEITDRIPLSDEETERWRETNIRYSWEKEKKPPATRGRANGRLRLSLPDHGAARQTWSEGRGGPLENHLAAVLEELERRAEADDKRAEEWARAEAERLRLEEERRERERLARIEQARAGRLAAEIAAWTLARQVREYIAVLRGRLPELDKDERTRVAAWCDWAEAWATRADPTLNTARIKGFDDGHDSTADRSRW
jgi:hypothetical protein